MAQVLNIRVDGADGLVDTDVPFHIYGDPDRGPTVSLMAGVHGCEYTSMLGLRRFLAGLDETALRGSLRVVPIANIAAFHARTAFVVPHDGLNLNRCFPGDPNGSFSERLAHALFENVIRLADYHIDLHAGDQVEDLEPFTIYDASNVEDQSRAMAFAYGLGYVVRDSHSASPIAGTSSAAAAAVGIASFTAEVGGCGLVDEISVHLAHLGKDKSQGVGYLEDGTMIVVENTGNLLDKHVEVKVTRSIQTTAGKMYFAKIRKAK